jgi:TniQ
MEVRDLASAILRLDGHKLRRRLDLDSDPPEELIAALAKYSSLRRSELERLIVRPTPAILPVMHRDAYCPQCFDEDRQHDVYYRRRVWLDAWTLVCERHGCALGRFEPVEFRTAEIRGVRSMFPGPREPARRKPSVVQMHLPRLLYDDGTHAGRFINLLLAMLKSTSGRDLLLHIGSASANVLYYELTGIARLWNRVWHDVERAPLGPPAIEHPLGPVETRVNAAYVATYLWDHLYRGTHNSHDRVVELLSDECRRSEHVFSSLQARWSRADRDQFNVVAS